MAESINIRMLQHFMYCPHRWGLMEIDKVWSENYFVVKANLQHERVHDPKSHHSSRGKKVLTALNVWNDELDLFGVTDCVELSKDPNGVRICATNEKYDLCIVEYKPTAPKDKDFNEDDAMQVFAQKICLDSVFGCNSKAMIYYADIKRRVSLPFETHFEQYEEKLKLILGKMRRYIELGFIPPIREGQKCSGCSMKDLCIPKHKKLKSVRERIEEIVFMED